MAHCPCYLDVIRQIPIADLVNVVYDYLTTDDTIDIYYSNSLVIDLGGVEFSSNRGFGTWTRGVLEFWHPYAVLRFRHHVPNNDHVVKIRFRDFGNGIDVEHINPSKHPTMFEEIEPILHGQRLAHVDWPEEQRILFKAMFMDAMNRAYIYFTFGHKH